MRNNNLLLENIIEGMMEKKGQEIIDLDLAKVENSICDHFVICHANSNTQVSAIADSIEKKVNESLNQRVNHREGMENAMWILLDFSDIIVHIFQKEFRDYYRLEELWGDAHISHIDENYH